jgi:hypothetical protein
VGKTRLEAFSDGVLAIAPRRYARRYRVDGPASSTYRIRTELRTMVNAAIEETG